MYAFVIEAKGLRVCGIIAHYEFPDLMYGFRTEAQAHGAHFKYERNIMVAEKGDDSVVLRVLLVSNGAPSRCVFDCLVEVMDKVFK